MLTFPSFRQLQFILALDRDMNFRIASEKCSVTQPTLSAAILEVEKIMGLPILDRSQRKKIVFTSFGLEFVTTIKRMMPHVDDIMERAARMSKPLFGTLRIGLIPTIAPYMLPDILPHLQEDFPNMDFNLTEAMSADLIDKLNNGEIDLAIMAFPYETPTLNQEIFYEEPFYCAAKEGTYKKNQELIFDDLEDQKLLLLEDGHCLRDHALAACNLQTRKSEKALNATSLLTLIQMVGQGYGITLLPEMATNHGILPKNVTLHRFKNPQPTRKIGVAWRKRDPKESDIMYVAKTLKNKLVS